MSADKISNRLAIIETKLDALTDIVLGRVPDEEGRKAMDAMLDMFRKRDAAAYLGGSADLPYTKAEAEELYTEAAKAEKAGSRQ